MEFTPPRRKQIVVTKCTVLLSTVASNGGRCKTARNDGAKILFQFYGGVEPSSSINDGLLDLSEAANYLRISNRARRDLCKRRAVAYAKINYRTWRFRRADLDRYLNRSTVQAKEVYA